MCWIVFYAYSVIAVISKKAMIKKIVCFVHEYFY